MFLTAARACAADIALFFFVVRTKKEGVGIHNSNFFKLKAEDLTRPWAVGLANFEYIHL